MLPAPRYWGNMQVLCLLRQAMLNSFATPALLYMTLGVKLLDPLWARN